MVTTVEAKNEKLDNVYNLEVESEEHNYFAEGYLVHNKIVPCDIDACNNCATCNTCDTF